MEAGPEEILTPLPSSENRLQDRQLALYRVLGKKNNKLGSIYMGAISAFKQEANPDRLAHVAHGFRELMEKLPRILDMPVLEMQPKMVDMVRPLQGAWKKATRDSHCFKNPSGSSTIDNHLQGYLEESERFFEWLKRDRPTRKQQAARALRSLDPQGRPLPGSIENLRVEEWDHCRNYFESVSHHNRETTSDEFSKWTEVLENFLLDRLAPRTYEDFSVLNALIREGESDGKS